MQKLGPYQIDAELSHSSICTVYRAFEKDGKRPVLIKKLHPHMIKEEDIRLRFEREAKVCARVKHPNIVNIYGIHNSPDLTMLAFEFIEGYSLADLIKKHGHIEWRVALAIFVGIAEGLAYAHSKGVIHRDIKPDNILISNQGIVKIADFGLAVLKDAPKMTRQGMLVGTPSYMPPEGISGSELNESGDLFSLGVTFYEMLTGVSPFQGKSVSETLQKILEYNPPPPSDIVSDIPDELNRILSRVLDKQPKLRHVSASQILADIRYLAEGPLPGQKLVFKFVNEGAQPEPTYTSPDQSETIYRKSWQKYRILWSSIAVVAVLFVIFKLLSDINLPLEPIAVLSDGVYSDTLTNYPDSITVAIDEGLDTVANKDPIVKIAPKKTDPKESFVNRSEPKPTTIDTIVVVDTNDTDSSELVESIPVVVKNESTGPGKLNVICKPWATVSIDNISYGDLQFPQSISVDLDPGEHQIVFNNNTFPSPVVKTVIIKSEKTLDLRVSLYDYFGAIDRIVTRIPRMWAEVWIDNKSYGWTPINKQYILPFGRHIVELKSNPEYKNWREEINLKAGDPPLVITVTLEPKQ